MTLSLTSNINKLNFPLKFDYNNMIFCALILTSVIFTACFFMRRFVGFIQMSRNRSTLIVSSVGMILTLYSWYQYNVLVGIVIQDLLISGHYNSGQYSRNTKTHSYIVCQLICHFKVFSLFNKAVKPL